MELINIYKGKRVLITGHTGFKGSWLSIWLNQLGANIIGLALDPKSEFDNFNLSNVSSFVKDIRLDIKDKEAIINLFKEEQPEIIFHLAAQALVLESYQFPLETFETNTMGTANILEAIRQTDSVKTAVFITTDKVYENKEWIWPYREDEKLGGYDPYSASKGASELIISSYRNSFFNPKDYHKHGKSIASVRAGNVIGGGDWAENRIIPDCIRALEKDLPVEIRSPKSVRPWQHVLEPLGGYLLLGAKMMTQPTKFAEAWNFGPEAENIITVGKLTDMIINFYEKGTWKDLSDTKVLHEARLLALDINKAKYKLNWKPVLSIDETIEFTINWYKNYKTDNMLKLCQQQIEKYTDLWKSRNEN
ncbi:MAG: CDP-glucose 4,6-dehydratase [Bacteroidales bacterium]|jgi:CDP-glucose 4,6-dehydratase|nr:CDP-glucose 4,6-dehydratase [Bacteroidales bacterium]